MKVENTEYEIDLREIFGMLKTKKQRFPTKFSENEEILWYNH